MKLNWSDKNYLTWLSHILTQVDLNSKPGPLASGIRLNVNFLALEYNWK